jgi:hypothetical protein
MILHGHIKQYENLSFSFGQAKNFRMFLVMGQSKWRSQKIKHKKTFVLWDSSQLIKLLNMKHNMYPSSCKSLSKK